MVNAYTPPNGQSLWSRLVERYAQQQATPTKTPYVPPATNPYVQDGKKVRPAYPTPPGGLGTLPSTGAPGVGGDLWSQLVQRYLQQQALGAPAVATPGQMPAGTDLYSRVPTGNYVAQQSRLRQLLGLSPVASAIQAKLRGG